MSKPVISALLVGMLAVGGVPVAFNSATAADLAVPAIVLRPPSADLAVAFT